MKQEKNNNLRTAYSEHFIVIVGIIILFLQTIAALIFNNKLLYFVINKFCSLSVFNLYAERIYAFYRYLDYLPLFHPYRFLWFTIIFVTAAPLLYIFFFKFLLNFKKDKLVRIFAIIFTIILIISLLKSIWLVWIRNTFFSLPLFIYKILSLIYEPDYVTVPKFLHLVVWMIFITIRNESTNSKNNGKKILSQFQFWIVVFWFLIHLWVNSNPDYFYYGYDPTPYFIFSFILLLICQIIAIDQLIIIIREARNMQNNA